MPAKKAKITPEQIQAIALQRMTPQVQAAVSHADMVIRDLLSANHGMGYFVAQSLTGALYALEAAERHLDLMADVIEDEDEDI